MGNLKQPLLFIGLLIQFSFCSAQNYDQLFFGKDTSIYKYFLFKVSQDKFKGYDNCFYLTYEDSYNFFSKVAYPEEKYTFRTNSDSLMKYEFSLIKIHKQKFNDELFLFELQDSLLNKTIFYLYDSKIKYPDRFPFLLKKKFDFKVKDYINFCTDFYSKIDEFTNEKEISSSSYTNGNIKNNLSIYKFINKTKTEYYLSASVFGYSLNFQGEGLKILFTDGTKLIKPSKFDVDAEDKGYDYSVFVKLSPSDLKLLSQKTIKLIRIDVHDEYINIQEQLYFRNYVNCILDYK